MAERSGGDSSPSMGAEALQAIRQNGLPGVVLWLIAAGVVALYYLVPAAEPAFAAVARWKAQGGFLYSIVCTALFAGAIPFLVLRILPGSRSVPWSTLGFLVAFWGYRGFEVDAFYRFQGLLFGNSATWTSVAPKVVVDMFVYNVVWAAGSQLLAYHWKNQGFRLGAFRDFDWARWVTRRIPVALISTWVVWIPVVTLVYSVPADLQIPLFNLAACFWSLVMATLTEAPRK